MNCPSCQRENRPDAVFCSGCGQRLSAICASCGRSNAPDASFCDACGSGLEESGVAAPAEREPRSYTPKHLADKILQSKSALEGERKQVTVLFADVKGSMELAEQVDPEEWHGILDRFFQILADGVHRFEGTVNQYTGDGIMALFGAPIAHEDHAQRACYAALHLRDELRGYADELRVQRALNFGTRIGVNSGEVVVGKIGDDLRMDYTAQGHTVGLAQRMEQLAPSDSVYLTQGTARLVEGFFQVRSLGESAIRGVSEPVVIYELEAVGAARSRLDVSRARGFSKFVGRHDEMSGLEGALQRATRGHGQVVGVVGEAGVGKSRLCAEFVEGCRAKGTRVLEAHCPAYGKAVPLLPILDLLRSSFGLTDGDSDQLAREKIAGRLLLLDDDFRETLPLVFDFLGVSDPARPGPEIDPEARQRQLFAFVRRLVQARSEQELAVLFFDDLHWVDAASDEFVAQLVEAAAATRTLLLVNFRPEYSADWTGKSYYQQLSIMPLGPEEIQELLRDRLGADSSVAPLCELIRERTGGNPFFIEEIVQTLMESGSLTGQRGALRLTEPIEQLEIPATVQAILAARIDRLFEREKRVLQTAAVIGREFSEPVLGAVLDLTEAELMSALSALKRAEFIHEQALYPVAEYSFNHPLTQEVAYGAQLAERRIRIHSSVARALEELRSESLDESAALLAHHLQEAGETLRAAHWHARAARWAGLNDAKEASRHWLEVRRLVKAAPTSEPAQQLLFEAAEQLLFLGYRIALSEAEADAIFAESVELAREQGDMRTLASLEEKFAFLKGAYNHFDESLEHVKIALSAVTKIDDPALEAMVRRAYARILLLTGDPQQGLAEAEAALARLAEIPSTAIDRDARRARILLHLYVGNFLACMGRPSEGARAFDAGIERARAEGELELEGLLSGEAYLAHDILGDRSRALELTSRGAEIAERLGGYMSLVLAYTSLGAAQVQNENWAEAIEALERCGSLSQTTGIGSDVKGFFLSFLSEAHLGSGDHAAAREVAEDALAEIRRSPDLRSPGVFLHLARARVFIREPVGPVVDAAERELEAASSLIEATGQLAYRPRIHELRAELARRLGDTATCKRELHETYRLYVEMEATGHVERLAKELDA